MAGFCQAGRRRHRFVTAAEFQRSISDGHSGIDDFASLAGGTGDDRKERIVARKTILVCDHCSREVERGEGRDHAADVLRRAPRGQGSRPLRHLRGRACPGAGRRGAAASRRRRWPNEPFRGRAQPALGFSRTFLVSRTGSRHKEPSAPGTSTGPMALTLLAGPANAGKVALLLDRYLADLVAGACPDRADRIGRRAGRARPAGPRRGAARRVDRDVRRRLRADREPGTAGRGRSPATRSAR